MPDNELETDLLHWIQEETETAVKSNTRTAASVKLLMLRLAVQMREGRDDSLTLSTEISLQAFDRANLFRTLMQLSKRGFVEFLGAGTKVLSPEEVNDMYAKFLAGSVLGEVRLSNMGNQEIERLRKFEKLSERHQAARRFERR